MCPFFPGMPSSCNKTLVYEQNSDVFWQMLGRDVQGVAPGYLILPRDSQGSWKLLEANPQRVTSKCRKDVRASNA